MSRSGRGAPSTACWPLADAVGLAEVRCALAEDRASEDVTTRLLGTLTARPATARFVAEARCVVAGLPVAALVFQELDRGACLEPLAREGAWVESGASIATEIGRAHV